MTEDEYNNAKDQLSGFIFFPNTYKQYLKWGSISHPLITVIYVCTCFLLRFLLLFIFVSPSFAYAFAAAKTITGISIHTVTNYFIHGRGRDFRTKEGYPNEDLAHNSWLGIILFGQYHANHHYRPQSANTGFKAKQFDLPFLIIKLYESLGLIKNVKLNKV